MACASVVSPIEIFAADEVGRRRHWSDADKVRIVEESLRGHRQGSATARRYGISRSLLTIWRREYRAGALDGRGTSGGFVPLVVEDVTSTRPEAPVVHATLETIDITLTNGRRMTIAVSLDRTWESLLRGCRRTGLTMTQAIAAIRSRELRAGKRSGEDGFGGIVLRRKDLDAFAAVPRGQDAGVGPDLARAISASVFGRDLGLHNNGDFAGLVEGGHTPAHKVKNPKTNRLQHVMTEDDITAFHRKFVTVSTLEDETGVHRNTVRKLLPEARIKRFAVDGRDFGPIYLREDVKVALPHLWKK